MLGTAVAGSRDKAGQASLWDAPSVLGECMPRRLSLKEAIQLTFALAIGPHADFIGFCLGLLAIAGVAAATWVNARVGPAAPADGVIRSLNLAERTRVTALVDVHTGHAVVGSAVLRDCRVGDHISLERRKAPVGFRYTVPANACSARRQPSP